MEILIKYNNDSNFTKLPLNNWTQSIKTESQKTKSQKTESQKTGSQKTGSQKTGSQKTESQKTESQKTESQKIESQKTGHKYKNIENLILSLFDTSCFNEYNDIYFNSKKIELSSFIDDDNNYDKLNFSKKMSKKIIQSGLYNTNNLSSIIFLCEYYKFCLYVKYNNKLYKLSLKYEDNPVVITYNKGWTVLNISISSPQLNKLSDLSRYIKMDIDISNNDIQVSPTIYKTELKPISKYLLTDIIELANKYNVKLIDDHNKKKTKKGII